MTKQFNGERLKKARIYRGLTVAELAEQVGCQRQTLSMYEISKSQPTEKEIVQRIARVLDFPYKFFYERTESCSTGTTYFRSLLTTNKRYRNEQIAKIDFLSHVFLMLQDYVAFPTFQELDLPDQATPEEAAYALRRAWNLGDGPIDNIVSIVEQHGILVTTFATNTDDVDAFSKFIGDAEYPTFLIAYSSNKTAAARIHFDIAHELGHICLHEWSEDIEELSKEEFKKREKEANEFAASFLLPEETFMKDAESGPHNLAYYKQLKKKWKVSIAAMIRRAENLGVLTTDEYQDLIRTMQRRGIRKEEPLDDVLVTATPALLKTSVIMLLQEGVFTSKEFMEDLSTEYGLSINPEEIEYLIGLPAGTLAQPKIIDISSIQLKRK